MLIEFLVVDFVTFFSFGYFTFIKKILPIKNKFTNLLFTHLAIV